MNSFYRISENSVADDLAVTSPSILIRKDGYSFQPENSSDGWEREFDYLYSKLASTEDLGGISRRLAPADEAPQEAPGKTEIPENRKAAVEAKKIEVNVRRVVFDIPVWVWVAAELVGLFLILMVLLVFVHLISLRMRNFELLVKGVPAGGEVFVDGMRWNLTQADGAYRLPALAPGEQRIIEIKRFGFSCKPQTVVGDPGEIMQVVAQCAETPRPQPVDECRSLKKGDYRKAAKCADEALARLNDSFSADELAKALNLYVVNFPSGKFEVSKTDAAFLQKAAGYIRKLKPDVVIEIGGHTDNVGDKAANLKLSENRARAVRSVLVSCGVKESALLTKGYGDSKPKPGVLNNREEGHFLNRRIEYTVMTK